MPETTPLLSGADGSNYYFLNNGTEGNTPLVRDGDGAAVVEGIPDGANPLEFEPKKLGPKRQVGKFQIPVSKYASCAPITESLISHHTPYFFSDPFDLGSSNENTIYLGMQS